MFRKLEGLYCLLYGAPRTRSVMLPPEVGLMLIYVALSFLVDSIALESIARSSIETRENRSFCAAGGDVFAFQICTPLEECEIHCRLLMLMGASMEILRNEFYCVSFLSGHFKCGRNFEIKCINDNQIHVYTLGLQFYF